MMNGKGGVVMGTLGSPSSYALEVVVHSQNLLVILTVGNCFQVLVRMVLKISRKIISSHPLTGRYIVNFFCLDFAYVHSFVASSCISLELPIVI